MHRMSFAAELTKKPMAISARAVVRQAVVTRKHCTFYPSFNIISPESSFLASSHSDDDDLPSPDRHFHCLCRGCLADLLYAALSDSICCLEWYMQALGQAVCENRSAESLHPSLVHVPSFETPLTLCCVSFDQSSSDKRLRLEAYDNGRAVLAETSAATRKIVGAA